MTPSDSEHCGDWSLSEWSIIPISPGGSVSPKSEKHMQWSLLRQGQTAGGQKLYKVVMRCLYHVMFQVSRCYTNMLQQICPIYVQNGQWMSQCHNVIDYCSCNMFCHRHIEPIAHKGPSTVWTAFELPWGRVCGRRMTMHAHVLVYKAHLIFDAVLSCCIGTPGNHKETKK